MCCCIADVSLVTTEALQRYVNSATKELIPAGAFHAMHAFLGPTPIKLALRYALNAQQDITLQCRQQDSVIFAQMAPTPRLDPANVANVRKTLLQ